MTAAAEPVDVVIVGAGPCGLAAAIAMHRAGLTNVIIERDCLVSGIASYPTDMTFFSTAEKISIGGVPFPVSGPKPTRRDALAYYRTVAMHFGVRVRQYETVDALTQLGDGRWRTESSRRSGARRVTESQAVVIATGYFGLPNRLDVPGEGQPHVHYRFLEGHMAYDQDVVVVGGANSAVDAALELYRAGARVTLVHFGPALDANVKPWVRPDIEARIKDGAIAARFNARVTEIGADWVEVECDGVRERLAAQHVFTMLGYMPETGLLRQVRAPIDPDTGIPTHNPATMETPLAGLFIAGVLASGFDANKTFIENGRFHGDLITARILEHRQQVVGA
ncbi:MAG: YpdA family putative bacillithiol disulfide reductase [Gemmatimonadaceae bacterium]|nr:YpdA family putative bacillithiol disulfide reductase [Gemmatimonadaceae bacterium]